MIIRCTQKLLKELRVKPEEPNVISSEGESWHANRLRIDRRKCVLFTHDTTLFSFFVPGLRRPDFDHFDVVFGEGLFRSLRLFDLSCSIPSPNWPRSRHISYAKTNNRSVLGSMNDLAFHIEYYIADAGGLNTADLVTMHQRINEIPFKAIGYKHPREQLQALLTDVNQA